MARVMFRLWAVGSVAWLALMFYAFSATGDLAGLIGDPGYVATLLGLPIAAGILLAGLVWAFRGANR